MAENRRDARYPARIVVRIVRRDQTHEFLTHDVSFRGVFVRTDVPPALRQLVKMELVLPSGLVVTGHAMVVHVAARGSSGDEDRDVPGMGLQFWGPLLHVREWEQFIHHLKHRQNAGLLSAKRTDKIRRASERIRLSLEIVFDGKTSMTRDISENGIAVRTDLELAVGTRTKTRLRAVSESLEFDVVVRRQIREPDFHGLGIELVDLDAAKREALVRFVRNNAPSEEVVFIQPHDPKLH